MWNEMNRAKPLASTGYGVLPPKLPERAFQEGDLLTADVPADEAQLAAGTAVIGVSINGQSRAYPLYILNNHQIVNDTVGGEVISASW